jgi:hypothetical protein
MAFPTVSAPLLIRCNVSSLKYAGLAQLSSAPPPPLHVHLFLLSFRQSISSLALPLPAAPVLLFFLFPRPAVLVFLFFSSPSSLCSSSSLLILSRPSAPVLVFFSSPSAPVLFFSPPSSLSSRSLLILVSLFPLL